MTFCHWLPQIICKLVFFRIQSTEIRSPQKNTFYTKKSENVALDYHVMTRSKLLRFASKMHILFRFESRLQRKGAMLKREFLIICEMSSRPKINIHTHRTLCLQDSRYTHKSTCINNLKNKNITCFAFLHIFKDFGITDTGDKSIPSN